MAGFITAEGLIVAAGGDTYDYVNDQRRLAGSIRSIVPVATQAAGDTVAAAMATDGRPVSDTNPLVTWQTDNNTLVVRGAGSSVLPITPTTVVTGGYMAGTAKPANKPWTLFQGFVGTSTGAGGDTRTATPATDGNGYGGFWFGYQGLPTFQGIVYANVMEGGNLDGFLGVYSIQSIDLTHIKWKGRRIDNTAWTNGYGGITLSVQILGWV